jgi:hypothetical protein
MKKYKTWEVIKMLTDNPKLRFKNERMKGILGVGVSHEIIWLHYETNDENRKFTMAHNPDSEYAKGNLIDEWTLVQQPIPFLEAVKAYAEGKTTIRCKSSIGTKRYKYQGCTNSPMLDENGIAVSHLEILEGTWFVEVDQ